MSAAGKAMSVRKLVRTAYGNTSEQRAIVDKCISIARSKLPGTAGDSSGTTATRNVTTVAPATSSGAHGGLQETRAFYTEVANHAEYHALIVPTMGSLSGVAVSVSDVIDVKGYQTRCGMKSSLFHRVPTSESAFIEWIRRRGAYVVGKLRCPTPMSWEDGVVLSKDFAAYSAVQRGASHFAITTTVLGAPAMTASYHHDTIGFKPTSRSLDTRTSGGDALTHPALSRNEDTSIGIVARTVDDVKYLWDVYTGAIQQQNVVASIHEAEKREEAAKRRLDELNKHNEFLLLDNTLSNEHDAFLDRIVGHRGRQEPQVAITVGFPSEWIQRYFSDVFSSAAAFEDCLHTVIQRAATEHGKEYRNVKVDIVELPFTAIDVEGAVKAHKTIAEYELARRSVGGGDGGGQLRSGMLDELPQSIVTALFNGRNITDDQYLAAQRFREGVVREIDNQFRDVDLICCPVVCDPYIDGNIRSVICTIPFALSGNPMLSARVDDKLALQFIGEMGRDTGLLEDATSLLRFMGKGRAPRWWRRKFLGEED